VPDTGVFAAGFPSVRAHRMIPAAGAFFMRMDKSARGRQTRRGQLDQTSIRWNHLIEV
jgi:hypothetical protein